MLLLFFSSQVWAAQAPVNWNDYLTPQSVDYGVLLSDSFSRNANKPYAPASDAKVFTAGAALLNLGADYQIETRLEWNQVGGPETITNLTLTGNGDPTWGMSEFGEDYRTRIDTFVDALKSQGVTKVLGPIHAIAGDPRWEQLSYPSGWNPSDRAECYGALAHAFNLQTDCASFSVTSPSDGAWKEAGITVPVAVKLKAAASTQLSVEVKESPRFQFVITGTFNKRSPNNTIYLPVLNTKSWIENLIFIALKDKGIETDPMPPKSYDPQLRSASYLSPPVSEIIKPMMKKSINVVAEALFKIMGSLYDQDPTHDLLEAGSRVMDRYVKQLGTLTQLKRGVSATYGKFDDQVTLLDGSGLSHQDLVTPAAMLALLSDLAASPDFSAIWESLPIAGVDGTLAHRMKGTLAEGVLRAKTGTLDGVYNLSGYVPQYNGVGQITEYVPFVILTHGPTSAFPVHQAQDKIGAKLVELLNAQTPASVIIHGISLPMEIQENLRLPYSSE